MWSVSPMFSWMTTTAGKGPVPVFGRASYAMMSTVPLLNCTIFAFTASSATPVATGEPADATADPEAVVEDAAADPAGRVPAAALAPAAVVPAGTAVAAAGAALDAAAV